MKYLTFLYFILLSNCLFSQENSNRIYFGGQYRITPIELNAEKSLIGPLGDAAVFDVHKSNYGPSFIVGIELKDNKKNKFNLASSLRFDYVAHNLGYYDTNSIEHKTQQNFIIDLYADYNFVFLGNKTSKSIGLGMAACGIGSGFNQTLSYDIIGLNGNVVGTGFTVKKRNHYFPAVYFNSGIQVKNKYEFYLRVLYSWRSPEIFKGSLILPEFGIKYFVTPKKDE